MAGPGRQTFEKRLREKKKKDKKQGKIEKRMQRKEDKENGLTSTEDEIVDISQIVPFAVTDEEE
jgi:hypothetical protein